ncbi:MAG: ribonuclease D, partial [Pseudomonadota bacterium]
FLVKTQPMLVDTGADLEKFIAKIAGAKYIALDTEFVREKTFFPKPCLIQIAADGVHACIDPLELTDLDPLLDLIFDTSTTKILHAARQDLEIFHRLRGSVPTPIFDTQIAADIAGLGEQISYATLVAELLDIKLDKTETRTNWAQRPLSEKQIHYAENDVIFLYQAYQELLKRIPDRISWVLQDSKELTHPELYEQSISDAYKRVKGQSKIKGKAKTLIRMLAGWREETAILRDLPRRWVLDDKLLIAIALNQPKTLPDLRDLGVPRKLTQRHGNRIFELVQSAVDTDEPTTQKPQPLSEHDRNKLRTMKALVEEHSKSLNVSSALLASKKDMIDLLKNRPDAKVLSGWRQPLIGEKLQEIAEQA